MESNQVRALLQKFQDGYAQRDLTELDEFMELFTPDDELEVIGTNAVTPGRGEWCWGRQATRELVASDWEHWGDVAFDVARAHISVKGDVAWLATAGTVTDTIPEDDCYTRFLDFAERTLKDEESDPQAKMLDIVRQGTDLMLELQQGETYAWPFRFTAVAVKSQGRWRFAQMQFSFPTTPAPDVRRT
jgi:ketosteroid isomerase-like protein